MKIKKKHIALLMMVALVCVTPACAQKPLTKPEKPQTYSPSSEKVGVPTKEKATDSKNKAIPECIHTRRLLYDRLKEWGVEGLPSTAEEFSSKLDNEETRMGLYKRLQEWGVNGIPEWETFNSKLSRPKGE